MVHRQLVTQLVHQVVSHQLSGARPAAPTDGIDLASWQSGAYSPTEAQLYLDGTAAASVTAPTGGTAGVELWGFKLGQWWLIGSLRSGAAIPIASDVLGAAERIAGIGGFDRLFLAGTASTGTITARLVPVEAAL